MLFRTAPARFGKLVLAAAAFVLLAAVLVSPAPAAAQFADTYPQADNIPGDVHFYFALRTDDAYIDQLDAIITRLSGSLPPELGIPPGLGLRAGLNLFTAALGGDFATVVRPWLGDAVTLSGYSLPDGSGSVLLSAEITDRDAALSLVETLTSQGGQAPTRTEENGFVVLENAGTFIAANESALYLATSRDLLPLTAPDGSLAANADFTATLGQLPATEYNVVAYVDARLIDVTSMAGAAAGEVGGMAASAASEVIPGPTAIGATIIGDNTLTLDIVQSLVDLPDLQAQGVTIPDTGAVDPVFLANIPADATLVVQGTNLKSVYDSVIASLPALSQQGDSPVTAEDIESGLAQVDAQFELLTGVPLREGLIDWLTGDYAVFLTYDVPEPGTPSALTAPIYPDAQIDSLGFDFGLIVEATDAARAQAFVDGVATALEQNPPADGTTITREDIAGTSAIVIAVPAQDSTPAFDVVAAANDRILVIGTRDAATAALEGSGGLNTAERFAASAQGTVLPNATTVWYADATTISLLGDITLGTGPAINNVFSNIVTEMGTEVTPEAFDFAAAQAQVEQQQALFRQVAALFSGATISTAPSGDGSAALIRLTLTLAR
ncbi:MAG: DUF3352 domain-containing protein [bacterium]|nr:DUF3352 domain-containing protein [bacterium]